MLALKIVVALIAALAIYLVAVRIIRSFLVPPEEPPTPAELRAVDRRYRCVVCGAEVTMTVAPGGAEPEAPRHCREEMALVGPQPA